jgi:hypothetical protein
MAKAKKSESAGEPKPAAAKTKTPKAKPSAASAGTMGVDTNLAASVAARQLFAGAPAAAQSDGKHSNSFRDFKDSVNKPVCGLAGLLDKTAAPGQKKPNMPFQSGGKQVGRNQTFGADVNRTGVPRRTGGG